MSSSYCAQIIYGFQTPSSVDEEWLWQQPERKSFRTHEIEFHPFEGGNFFGVVVAEVQDFTRTRKAFVAWENHTPPEQIKEVLGSFRDRLYPEGDAPNISHYLAGTSY